jgi:hypothetical protein
MKIKDTDQWTFHYPDIVPIEIPVTTNTLSSNEVLFRFPFGNRQGEIALHLNTLKGGTFQGNYKLPCPEMSDSITFTIAEKGKKLIGKPAGFHGPMQWVFTRQ